MANRLYLDTARLGRMSPGAQRTHRAFTEWGGLEAGTWHFDAFLRHGFTALPLELQRRHSGLVRWEGIAELKTRLAVLAEAEVDTRVFLANRSSQLMRFAAELLCSRCHKILVTDCSWPAYAVMLERTARKAGVRLVRVPARDVTLAGEISVTEFVSDVAELYRRHRCDGLFLPAVDNCGIRLPTAEIADAIRQRSQIRCFVVDAAQGFCHVPLAETVRACDFLIAGCHKWLGAYHPLGLGFAGRLESRSEVEMTLSRLLDSGQIDDPLLALTEACESGRSSPFGETVHLASLFSCCGAVADAIASRRGVGETLTVRRANAQRLIGVARDSGWNVLEPMPGFRSGIILLESPVTAIWALPPAVLRQRLLEWGVAATTYRFGRVRLSMPDRPWQADELATLRAALRSRALMSHSANAVQNRPLSHATTGGISTASPAKAPSETPNQFRNLFDGSFCGADSVQIGEINGRVIGNSVSVVMPRL